MARSKSTAKKTKTTTKKATTDIVDAEVIAEDVKPVEETVADEIAEKVDEAVDLPDADSVEAAVDVAEGSAPVKSKSGFFPMVLGGIVAAGIGAGAAYYFLPKAPDLSQQVSQQTDKISGIDGSLGELTSRLAAVEAREIPQDVSDDVSSVLAQLETLTQENAAGQEQITTLVQRLDDLEKRPVTDVASQEAIAAYDRELTLLKDTMASQRTDLEALAAKASAEIAAAREEAVALKEEAEQVSKDGVAQAATSRILVALETGTDFGDILAELQETGSVVNVPTLLLENTSGVASTNALQEGFDPAARAALALARSENPKEGNSVSSFLKTQLGVRSLTPQEGDSPDAVLSRAQAAVDNADFELALSEIDSLPDAAKNKMQSWIDQVQLHLNVQSAAKTLLPSSNSN